MTYVSVYKRKKVMENKGKKCKSEFCKNLAKSKGFCIGCCQKNIIDKNRKRKWGYRKPRKSMLRFARCAQ